MKTDQFPIVTVEWADHYSDFQDVYSEKDAKELVDDLCIRKSTGHLIAEGQRQIMLAGTVDYEEGEYTFSEVFVCMKRAILKRSDR